MSELPTGWVEVELGEVFRGKRRSSVVPAKEPDRRFELYSVPSFETGVPERLYGSEIGSSKQEVAPGSVLLCRINPRINRVWVVGQAGSDPQIASTEWISLPRVPGMAPRFALQALQTPEVRRHLTSSVSGVGGSLMRVRMDALWRTKIPLAPLPEQHRIVAKIESLFVGLDEGIAALKRAQANLERYRASVLKSAVEGRLTEQWRRENPPEETGEELLQRILAVRRKRWEEGQLAKFEAKGRKRPRNWRAKYKEPVTPDTSGLPGLPEGWCWAAVGQVFDVYVGATPKRSNGAYWGGDIRWVSSGEVAFHDVWETRERITARGLSSCSAKLHPPGTVMLAMIGEGRTRGQTAVLQESASHNQNSAAIRVSEAGHEPRWVFHYLRARYELTRANSSGNNQPALSKRRVEAIPIPVPPILEQAAIVREIEGLLSTLDPMLDGIVRYTGRGRFLRQSILKRAFEGRLVPQDPTDEPASILLERIRNERDAERKRRKRRPTRPKRQPKTRVS